MSNINDAKRSVALKTCIALHKIGELDDRLLPRKVESVLEHTNYLFPLAEDEDMDDGVPGTTKHKRRHDLVVSFLVFQSFDTM